MSWLNSLSNRFSSRLARNIKYSLLVKLLHVLTNLYLVHLSIEVAGETNYGIWLTILSLFTWFSSIEVGINNSFRRKLTTHFDAKNWKAFEKVTGQMFMQSLTHYGFAYLLIGLALTIVPVQEFFRESLLSNSELRVLLLVCLALYFGHFIAFGMNTILLAIHRAKDSFLWMFLQSVVALSILLFYQSTQGEVQLIELTMAYSIGPLVCWIAAIVYYRRKLPIKVWSSDSFQWHSRILKSKKTRNFFLIQVATLTIYSTDHLAIMQLISSDNVAFYQVAFKYFNIMIVVFNIALVPFWSEFSSASNKQSIDWIKRKLKQLMIFWLGFLVLSLVMLTASNFIYGIWIGNEIQIPMALNIMVAVFILQTMWNTIFTFYLNAIEEIKSQVWILCLGAFINVPLSIYFASSWGVAGIIGATCISWLPLSMLLPIQSFKSLRVSR